MSFDPTLLMTYWPLMASGLMTTIQVCLMASLIALPLGLLLAISLLSPMVYIRIPARIYVEIMRGIPVLVLLFLIYYGGPSIGLTLDPMPAGILGLGFYGAAFFAEIFRAGFQSIPQGQVEAARMVGLKPHEIIWHIKLPQMAALIIPSSTNQLIILVKESALVSVITVSDLTKNATQMANETFAVVEPFLFVAFLYWLLIEGAAQLSRMLEKRVKWKS
jgi:polar amino acid transport system permease protein